MATAAFSTSGRPQISVIAATLPSSPRQVPITSSQRSIVHSGLASAVSVVASATAWKAEGSRSASARA